ncbi:tRNA (guanine(27)-N(2))-dimethyltransferase isoform X2 [Tamandua tetradactyla]|uniref:tRNA (guanine(27)-N(2))-dimethyltransferase isoform X2 n=1 Tax=Tamandua tetradactyla TaxID=48850 RepID=UPI00405397B6
MTPYSRRSPSRIARAAWGTLSNETRTQPRAPHLTSASEGPERGRSNSPPRARCPLGTVVLRSETNNPQNAPQRLFRIGIYFLRLRTSAPPQPAQCTIGYCSLVRFGGYRPERKCTVETELSYPIGRRPRYAFAQSVDGVVTPWGKAIGVELRSLPLAFYFSAGRIWLLGVPLLSVARIPPSLFAFPLLGSSPLCIQPVLSPCCEPLLVPGWAWHGGVTMENMAEEELLLLEEEVEVAQVQVPIRASDSARVPTPAPDSASAPALDSAPTPASAPVPAPALAQAPALSPSLASAPEEAESRRHISIQRQLADLEKLAFVTEGDFDSASSLNSDNLDAESKQSCPLCPTEKFRACNSHKLRRHLQNLHWKVSVEFEGYRMCICHLPCRPVKPNIIGEQMSSKMGAHYHCIICSATITRRTDMLGHVRRHVNKGETKSRYIAVSATKPPNEVLKETDTDVQVCANYSIPQKTDSYFNPKMKLNRQLIFCTLAALAKERKPLECLDAFGATGIMGLQWAKHLGNAVKVTINDLNENSVTLIQENCHLNKLKVVVDSKKNEESDDVLEEGEENLGNIKVTKMDANVLMHLRSFDFIHLDPFGTSVNYLDSAFRNIRNLGIVSVTSTDISSLYAKAQHVARRHYGCNIVRTEYYKELAARIVVAAVARAAARCNKGIEVLFAVALEHFVLVVVRVLRGPTSADETAKKIQYLIHCQWCEERIFQKDGNMVEENPYRQLPCNCHGSMPGKTAIELGPLWSSSLFNTGFLKRILFESLHHGLDDIQTLIKTLIFESECTPQSQFSVHSPSNINKQVKRKSNEMITNLAKRQKADASTEHPPFYYNIHRHSIKGMNMPKLKKFLCYLSQAGFRVSRTHFDPMGVRTDAPLMQFKSILLKYSTPTYTGGQSEGHIQSASEDTVADRVEMSVNDKAEAGGCRRL